MEFFTKTLFLDQFTPVLIYQKAQNIFKDEVTFLFESVVNNNDGNFSYILIGDRERIIHKNGQSFYKDNNGNIENIDTNPFVFLKKYYQNINSKLFKNKGKELGVGLIDGFIGNIGYDMVKEWEPTLKQHMDCLKDELNIPDLDLIRPKMVLIYSHKTSKLTCITSMDSFKHKIDIICDELQKGCEYTPLKKAIISEDGKFTLSKEEFFNIVEKYKKYIKEGDVFQILASNRYTQKAKVDHLSFYRALRSKNPSPYLFLLEYKDFSIAGSSPEVMVRLTNGQILLRPIAGTRKRGDTPSRDKEMETELINDPKEIAEHVMLIDLGRNDVSKIAQTGTVKVTNSMRVEKYSHVMHLVSDIEATLDNNYDMFDLFSSTFTAGTMTGAPKIRAMELIAQNENIKRNFYSGSIAYFGFDGNMDSAITIRTTLLTEDTVVFQSGAGIVANSIPELEFLEVKNKLAANISTLEDLV
ncbi:Anthranilate synthase, aminase component [hydrothermal vent metagenome]|uniref:Anthranilate synthase component 1 n=1 Tax=hydrothermal vent metagenome TaxID=652676 RepID=A0A3B1E9I7_9ZZZZ